MADRYVKRLPHIDHDGVGGPLPRPRLTIFRKVIVWLRGKVAPKPRLVLNEYGRTVTQFKCDHCGDVFTVTGVQTAEEWGRVCLARTCTSYDPDRDVDYLFGRETDDARDS